MFVTYYSNQAEIQKDILLTLLENLPHQDPFVPETILVQSPGMAQWLQMEMAKKQGVAANIAFPMPSSFIWSLYAENLPNVSKQNPFEKETALWRLMRLIPRFLSQPEFAPLRQYLASSPQLEQQKLYQLSLKVADLFDQYLVYRPQWIAAWESGNNGAILEQIQQQKQSLSSTELNETFVQQLKGNIAWQGILWRELVADIQADFAGNARHRAALNQQFIALCQDPNARLNLPERLFIFGIPALPAAYLQVFQAISQRTDVHLFFNNPCQEYWGDLTDLKFNALRERQRFQQQSEQSVPLLSEKQTIKWQNNELESTYQQEQLLSGNSLLASWGKMGRDFLYQLVRDEETIQGISRDYYAEMPAKSLLGQLQNQILHSEEKPINIEKNDRSFVVKSCHSAMREVEVLQDYLLGLFNENKGKDPAEQITPKDVVVMVADINQYTPYIQAVFGGSSSDEPNVPTIPFSISDNKLSESDVLVSSFLALLNLKESTFSAEDVLALLDVPAIRERFDISLPDLAQIRQWVIDSGIRFGLEKGQNTLNFNAWQAGIERMTLGNALREEHGIWQQSLGLDSSYGLKGQLVGKLNGFFARLQVWHNQLQQAYSVEKWQAILTALLTDFFAPNEENSDTIFYIQERINAFVENLQEVHFDDPLHAEVIFDVMASSLEDSPNSLRFLAGKVNFCTLLPMRSIPFKVVCLLGMNEADYPRIQTPNSFDLMQYHHQKGDRVRRDDDRYLFLEALLAARSHFYVSYIGSSIIDNQPKEPSVLLSQLLDYIQREQQDETLQIEPQPMTAFSVANFQKNEKNHRSFAKKWFPIANAFQANAQEFAVPMKETGELIHEIELDHLIEFVSNPVKFFFEKQLGVYFRDENDRIDDHENFTLNGLDVYRLSNELLYLDETEFDDYFAKEQIKGTLPRGEFAQVYAENVRANVLAFKEKIADLPSSESESVDFHIKTTQGDIRLFGYMHGLFGETKQAIEWQFASSKDRYRICPWIYYLIQLATKEQAVAPRLITKNEDVTLKTLEKSTALEQLKVYVEAYLQSQLQIQPIPTENIAHFLTKEKSAVNFDDVLAKIQALGKDDPFSFRKADPYWARLLAQTQLFDTQEGIEQLMDKTDLWFGEMMDRQ